MSLITTDRPTRPYPDIAIGLAVFVVGVLEVMQTLVWPHQSGVPGVFFVGLLGSAVACFRLRPDVGLALAWLAGGVQIFTGAGVMIVELSLMLLAYGAARHGKAAVVWLSGLSIPASCAVAAVYFATHIYAAEVGFGWVILQTQIQSPGGFNVARSSPLTRVVLPIVVALLVLAGPWLVGLVLRIKDAARLNQIQRARAEEEAARSQEIAHVREGQARLARDVHDVVGHSLTVILAQADSVQFLPDSDIGAIRATLANIALSARRSLGDVRQVLSSTGDAARESVAPGELDTLIEGVRAAGNTVRETMVGVARPLPPELDVVAFRVLQEMLTNALKHGARDETIAVDRIWGSDDVKIEVRNVTARPAAWPAAEGLGLAGMRLRLESVGGRLDVYSDGPLFIATARVPARPRPAT